MRVATSRTTSGLSTARKRSARSATRRARVSRPNVAGITEIAPGSACSRSHAFARAPRSAPHHHARRDHRRARRVDAQARRQHPIVVRIERIAREEASVRLFAEPREHVERRPLIETRLAFGPEREPPIVGELEDEPLLALPSRPHVDVLLRVRQRVELRELLFRRLAHGGVAVLHRGHLRELLALAFRPRDRLRIR
jgi:hypothetical protein